MLTRKELYNMILPDRQDTTIRHAMQFGLNEDLLSKSKISELSGGERKKVFLAIAFSSNPKLMILDEPTNSLDIEGKALLKELLKNRKERTLIVTHDTFIDDITGHIYTIKRGGNYEHI